MSVGTSGTINDLARLAAESPDGEIPASANGLRIRADRLQALQHRIVRMPAAERRRLPGIEDKRADLLPAGVTLLATIFDVFEIDEMVTSDWALREGIVLDAVRVHDPDDWSDDPRAAPRRGRRARAPLRFRRRALAAGHATRAEHLRSDPRVARPRRRRPRDARVRRDAARHRPARVAQGPPSARGVSRRSRAAPRLRARRDRVPRRARAPPPARRHQDVGTARRRPRQGRATGCASWPRCCAWPTASTAAGAA